MIMIKKYPWLCVALCLSGITFISCNDDETYAEQKEKERKAIDAFIKRDVLLLDSQGDSLCYVGKINVISEAEFMMDSITDLEKNEYVMFSGSGVYMQIVRRGVGEPLHSGQSKRVISRYFEYNILGDSLQTTNRTPYWATNPEIMDDSNNSGTISASFNTTINGGGAMYMVYNKTSVPSGWIVPLSYVNLGRQVSADEGIAKVRLIVPHSQGQTDATSNVYPCFYEITYQEMRE